MAVQSHNSIVRLASILILLLAFGAFTLLASGQRPAPVSMMPEMRGSLSLTGLPEQQPAATVEQAAIATVQPTPSIPPHPMRTALMLLHIAGLVAGLGSALFLDLFLLSRLYHRPIDRPAVEVTRFGSRIVLTGLCALWVSGLGFLAFYSEYAPGALTNPKIWAKIVIVAVLTVNGILLHRFVLPRMEAGIGRSLLAGQTWVSARLPLAIGAISSVSWAAACLLGVVKELNYVAPATTLLVVYALTVIACLALASRLHAHFTLGSKRAQRLGRFARLNHA